MTMLACPVGALQRIGPSGEQVLKILLLWQQVHQYKCVQQGTCVQLRLDVLVKYC